MSHIYKASQQPQEKNLSLQCFDVVIHLKKSERVKGKLQASKQSFTSVEQFFSFAEPCSPSVFKDADADADDGEEDEGGGNVICR